MCIRGNDNRRAAFTLLEVIIATAIIALLTMSLYGFINSTLQAIEFTTQMTEDRQSLVAVATLIGSQLNDLPPRKSGVLLGKQLKIKGVSTDELTWLTREGQGVMTGAAPGEYRVTFTAQESEKDKSVLELGLRRELVTPDEKSDMDFFKRGGAAAKYNWLPLYRPVAGVEIRYWDPRLNSPVSQWNDPNARPAFVHMKIWKTPDDLPYEVVMPVPSWRIQAQ
jgi:prepilin-type N-terminal cleavage/methylation domain-containing protein